MKKKIQLALATLALVGTTSATVAAYTYAAFSDEVTAHHVISSGNLKLGLYRTGEVGTYLDENGYLAEDDSKEVYTDPVDLKAEPDAQFKITDFVPGAHITAIYRLDNLGSTAFDATLKFVPLYTANDQDAADLEKEFAKQLSVVVTVAGVAEDEAALDGLLDEESEVDLGRLTKGSKEATGLVFTIDVRFVPGDDNNKVQNTTLSFDFKVIALQSTTAPANS